MEKMTVYKLKITVDRKTGKELSNELVGTAEIDKGQYYDNWFRLLTGMNRRELYTKMVEHYYGDK